MSRRNWDKLRRNDKAKGPSPIDSFKPKQSRNAKLRRLRRAQERLASAKGKPLPQEPRPQPKSKLPFTQKILTVYSFPKGERRVHGTAVFTRIKGGWRCITATGSIEWFTRIHNLDLIEQWIRAASYHPVWTDPSVPQQTQEHESNHTDRLPSTSTPQTEDRPAHPSMGCPAQADNTSTSLNNATRPDHQCSSPGSGRLERNGVTTSSPLNAQGMSLGSSQPPVSG